MLFALASLIVHGVVLGHGRIPFTLPGQAEHVLSVRLVRDIDSDLQRIPNRPPQATAPAPVPPPPPRRSRHDADPQPRMDSGASVVKSNSDPGDREARARPEGNPDPSRAARPPRDAEPRADRPTAAAARSEADSGQDAQTRIRSRLKIELARYFNYPHVARLRGLEGSVLLAFRVEMNGRLERIRVAQSSGFAVLDRSALDSLARVDVIPGAVTWLDGHDMDMQIPVIYRLEGPY